MNTKAVKGSWEEKKGKLKQKFTVLTQNDLMFAGVDIEKLYSRLQIKLGITRAEIQEIIESL